MRAAFYECDVTPPLGGHLNGKARRDAIAADVKDKLYVKAAVFEHNGEIAAIVGMDTCHVPDGIHDFVTKRVNEYTGISSDKIMITSNHTHTGAPVSSSSIFDITADESYRDVFFRLVADAVILAYKRLQSAEAKFGTALVEGVAYNRDYVLDNGYYVTHGRGKKNIVRPLGKTDPTVSVLMVESNGKKIGAVVNFACHQDSVGAEVYSGDYSSVISKELKNVYGQDFVSLFLVGACGNINHANPDENVPLLSYEEIGKKLSYGVIEAINSAKPTGDGVMAIKDNVTLKKRILDTEELRKEAIRLLTLNPSVFRAYKMMSYSATKTVQEEDVFVAGVKIGNTCMHFLPGEMFVEYALDLKKRSPFKNNIVIENSNSRVPYIPTEDVFIPENNMYEATLGSNCHEKGAGKKIVEKAVEIANKLIK